MTTIDIQVTWSKHEPILFQLTPGQTGLLLKQLVQDQTGVPIDRQKLLCRKTKAAKKLTWKGTLKDDFVFQVPDESVAPTISVTLMGSSAPLEQKPAVTTKFIEDMSPEELQLAEREEEQAAWEQAEGMIVPLQRLPQHRKEDDHKSIDEPYGYNRLVTGLPQRQVERLLKRQRGQEEMEDNKKRSRNNPQLLGEWTMTMGMPLRRAYINEMAVLPNGTLITANDDGHVQLWKYAALEKDIIHPGRGGGVDSVVGFTGSGIPGSPSFATAGRGSVQLWNEDADPIARFPSPMPGGIAHRSLTAWRMNSADDKESVLLAARMKVIREPNPNPFPLTPQDEEGRRRMREALAREQYLQETTSMFSKQVQVWHLNRNKGFSSKLLAPGTDLSRRASISCLATMRATDGTFRLVAGDDNGGLTMWNLQFDDHGDLVSSDAIYLQLVSEDGGFTKIVAIQTLSDGRLLVSTDKRGESTEHTNPDATVIPVPIARGVHILKYSEARSASVDISLDGHKDVATCVCELPDGSILTGGGKHDATVQLWSKAQLQAPSGDELPTKCITESTKTMEQMEYVLSLLVLRDAKEESNHFAVATARYNVVKLFL